MWDESFESWNFYGVSGQPAYALIGADGLLVERGFGMFPGNIADELG